MKGFLSDIKYVWYSSEETNSENETKENGDQSTTHEQSPSFLLRDVEPEHF
jgi:hypothetical protein